MASVMESLDDLFFRHAKLGYDIGLCGLGAENLRLESQENGLVSTDTGMLVVKSALDIMPECELNRCAIVTLQLKLNAAVDPSSRSQISLLAKVMAVP